MSAGLLAVSAPQLIFLLFFLRVNLAARLIPTAIPLVTLDINVAMYRTVFVTCSRALSPCGSRSIFHRVYVPPLTGGFHVPSSL